VDCWVSTARATSCLGALNNCCCSLTVKTLRALCNMAQCQAVEMEEGEAPDFTFRPTMLQGRLKQRCLWQCGFHNTYAAQVGRTGHPHTHGAVKQCCV